MWTQKQYLEYLALYGAEIRNWPEELRATAMHAQHDPSFAALTEEQLRFDSLLQQRRFEPARPGLSERILAAASYARPADASIAGWMQELFAWVLPRPAFAFATMLTLGIIIGFGMPAQIQANGADPLQIYFDDEGIAL